MEINPEVTNLIEGTVKIFFEEQFEQFNTGIKESIKDSIIKQIIENIKA